MSKRIKPPSLNAERDARIALLVRDGAESLAEALDSWYRHFQSTLEFPIAARVRNTVPGAPEGYVQVVGLEPPQTAAGGLFAKIIDGHRTVRIPVEDLDVTPEVSEAHEAFTDWKYWQYRRLLA